MEKIRALAREGLMALPRVGMGVGGLLLGTRQGRVIRLVDSVEIPCSHTGGPSFNLTNEEKQLVRELIAGAGQPGVVGWYCSKTRGAAALGDAELAIYREFFLKPGQISLVLRPRAAEPTRAAFFFRDEKGNVVKGVECEIEEWRPAEAEIEPAPEEHIEQIAEVKPAPSREEERVAAPAAPPNLVVNFVSNPVLPVVSNPAVVASSPDVVSHAETMPIAALPEPSPFPPDMRPTSPVTSVAVPDMFAFARPAPRRNKRLVWILGAAAMLAAGAAAFLTQDSWLPRPPLTLSSTESNGNLVIRWNVDALRGSYHASMFVNDGGNLQLLPLDRFQLNQGVLIYSPKSKRVTAKLSAGEASAIAVWLAPAPAAPAADALPPAPDVSAQDPHAGNR